MRPAVSGEAGPVPLVPSPSLRHIPWGACLGDMGWAWPGVVVARACLWRPGGLGGGSKRAVAIPRGIDRAYGAMVRSGLVWCGRWWWRAVAGLGSFHWKRRGGVVFWPSSAVPLRGQACVQPCCGASPCAVDDSAAGVVSGTAFNLLRRSRWSLPTPLRVAVAGSPAGPDRVFFMLCKPAAAFLAPTAFMYSGRRCRHPLGAVPWLCVCSAAHP